MRSQPAFSSPSTPAGLSTFTAASAPVTAASPFPSISDLHRTHIPEVHLLNQIVCTRSLVPAIQLQLSSTETKPNQNPNTLQLQ
ncbi:hypothetical protein EV2_023148 [Malus domestica]